MTLGGDTITVVSRTRTGTDPNGLAIRTETETTITGCSFQAGQVTECDGRTNVITHLARVFMPITPVTTAITPTSAIKFGGLTWEVRGPVTVPTDLDGHQHHVLAIVEWQAG